MKDLGLVSNSSLLNLMILFVGSKTFEFEEPRLFNIIGIQAIDLIIFIQLNVLSLFLPLLLITRVKLKI